MVWELPPGNFFLDLPSKMCVKCVPKIKNHPKNRPKGRHFTYRSEDPGITYATMGSSEFIMDSKVPAGKGLCDRSRFRSVRQINGAGEAQIF